MLKNLQPGSGPYLVIAPLSVIVNWQREINTWTDLDVILYYGSQDDRDLIRSYEFKFLNKNCPGHKIEVIITTPETCVAHDVNSNNPNGRIRRELSCIDWDLIIVDEAHKLKNYDSKIASTLREEYSFKNCVLLTGTPLQNNTEELWNLLNFIARDDFHDRDEFITDFGELKTATQLEKLHKKIKPYLLRREKELVEKTVPPKEEIIIEVELTVPQKQYYRAIYEQKTNFLYKQGAKDGPNLTNLAMELRKCCNHPFLIKGAGAELSKHFANDSNHEILVKASGKMTLLDKLLPKLKEDGHRVLIFSQFRMMLDIIEDYVHQKGYFYDRVDGSIVGKKRQGAIDRYTNNDNVFIMLLSTRAGGVGINLTAADTVIIFDSDWNPQNDIQAQARAHRIGQTRPVTVYRLLTKKSYEMVMFRAASIKLGLDYAIMHNLKGTKVGDLNEPVTGRTRGNKNVLAGISVENAEHVSSLTKKELENLLKHGAYDMFLEEKEGQSENESRYFVESSIEQILETSSTFLHKENDSNIECTKVSNNNATFGKASFISASAGDSGENNEVAIDDPDFWSKVVGLSVEDQAIQLGAKRKCRQNIDSYREPTDSIRSIFGSKSAAYVTDSEDDNDSNDGGKRKKSKKSNEIVLVPADFTADNLTNLSLALVNMGYLSWDAVRMSSKIYWKNADIAKACRHIILFLFLASSIQNEGNGKTGKKNVENKNGSEEMEVDNENNEKNDNDDGDENNDETAETTENNTVENKEVNSAEATSEKPGVYKFDVKVGKSYLTKYKGLKLALKSYLESKQEVEEEPVPVEDLQIQNHIQELKSLLPSDDKMEVEDQQLTIKKMKEAFDKDFTVDFENHLEAVFEKLSQDEIVKALLQEEKDLNKMAKKTNMRAKLAQVEDLFESKIFSLMASEFQKVEEQQVVPAETTEPVPVQESLPTTPDTEAEPKATEPIIKFELKIEYDFLAKELEG
jgi:superfamily II DNA or RNA helicase